MSPEMLQARKEALEELFEALPAGDYDIAEHAIDKYLDYLEDLV